MESPSLYRYGSQGSRAPRPPLSAARQYTLGVLLEVSGVVKDFADSRILDGATLRVEPGEKVALVGRNGCGKTTLLRLIAGLDEPDAGSIRLARGARVLYLRQDTPVTPGRTVLEEAESGASTAVALRDRMRALEAVLESDPNDEDLAEYALLHEHFLEAEGYSLERDVRTVLARMGFGEDAFDKRTDTLSGGERTRLALARILLEEPELLVLDEPTNHLDLQAAEWLEGWVRGYHGAVLVVSHDRVFLTAVAERVLEMRDGRIDSYPGRYETYLRLRVEREARDEVAAKKLNTRIAELDSFVRRFMGGERTAQARGRLKLKERLEATAPERRKASKSVSATLRSGSRTGELVAVCEGLTLGYHGEALFPALDWTVRRGERWGVIGENGVGKSTLLKALLGLVDPLDGRATLGAGVAPGWFDQDACDLPRAVTPVRHLIDACGLLPEQARGLLGCFLLSGDDTLRPIGTLSGGERNKVALAVLAARSPNVMILDEPTNHLDMDSREALAAILRAYDGTLILVSHDRWLLDETTQHTLDIRRSGAVQFPGPYGEYRRSREAAKQIANSQPARATTSQVKHRWTPRQLSKEIERVERRVHEMERVVDATAQELRSVEAHLAAVGPGDDVFALSQAHQEGQRAAESALAEWTELSVTLEHLQELRGE